MKALQILVSSFVLASTFAALPATAAAETEAEACYRPLADLDEARETLEDLQRVVDQMKADREALDVRESELVAELFLADGEEKGKLEAELVDVRAHLKSIADLLPAIETQAEALATDVDSAERDYIACIERTID